MTNNYIAELLLLNVLASVSAKCIQIFVIYSIYISNQTSMLEEKIDFYTDFTKKFRKEKESRCSNNNMEFFLNVNLFCWAIYCMSSTIKLLSADYPVLLKHFPTMENL